jgi:4-aminobutyrate aminotransferase-like enzyme
VSEVFEHITGPVPGPRSFALAESLARRESRNVTYLADDFPIFWESAHDAIVEDVDGNRYIDCTAAFGVANAGHANRHVTSAVAQQAERLVHGMGDVHPTEIRVRLLERLPEVLPRELTRVFLATTGSEAVEAALKTAMLATGRFRIATYRGGYHGLSLGALAAGGIDRFRLPFAGALAPSLLLEFPREGSGLGVAQAAEQTRNALERAGDVAAVVIEPVQGRAGCLRPIAGYLTALRRICDDLEILLVVDEIYTGFGRTGHWFAIEREGIVPDLLCIGKAFGSGFPISATIGRSAVMDAWPRSTGEALHTSTYLGNPIGCAAALATIDELAQRKLPQRAAELGQILGERLQRLRTRGGVVEVRGCGLFWAVQVRDAAKATAAVKGALARGAIFLQSGVAGDAITIAPPLTIGEDQLLRAVDILQESLA